MTPVDTWAALAPALAARGRLRLSRDGGRTYKARGERPVTERLPNQPAAVLLFDHQGCAPVIVFDLDSSRGGPAAVDVDLSTLTGLLRRCGATSWFSDHSPNGGRHLYLPLADPVPVGEVVQLMAGLRTMLPTLDQTPMVNAVAGCIRPPGARHKTGGHQTLDGTVQAATAALSAPNPALAWAALCREATAARNPGQPTSQGPAAPGASDGVDVAGDLAPLAALPGGDRGLSAKYLRIARTGDTTGYRSPSEARQAVMWAAVWAGWELTDVLARMADGTWPGLASLFARYGPQHRTQAIRRDWAAAHRFEKSRRRQHQEDSVRVCTTSMRKTHRGAHARTGRSVNQQVRAWLAAVDLLAKPDDDLAYRAVLYALAEAAVLTDSLVLEHGNRSLAIAVGLDQVTVGRILNTLADAPPDQALIQWMRPATALRGATYELVIPHALVEVCEAKPWRRGRIHGIRPVFRALGLPAAFVYAALEQLDGPVTGRELARLANLGVTATYDALAALAAWGLATRDREGWSLGHASVTRAAERAGALEHQHDQINRYRAERHAWRALLGIITPHLRRPTTTPPPSIRNAAASDPPNLPELDLLHRPPDDPLRLVEQQLGATVIAQHPRAG